MNRFALRTRNVFPLGFQNWTWELQFQVPDTRPALRSTKQTPIEEAACGSLNEASDDSSRHGLTQPASHVIAVRVCVCVCVCPIWNEIIKDCRPRQSGISDNHILKVCIQTKRRGLLLCHSLLLILFLLLLLASTREGGQIGRACNVWER
jgi:hypothetical protein